MVCIGCPMGCYLTAEVEGDQVLSVTGNSCPRGAAYARRECVAPMRTVTGTVRLNRGGVVSVRTAGEVPKEKVTEVAAALKAATAVSPVAAGEVLIRDVAGTGVDVIATADAR